MKNNGRYVGLPVMLKAGEYSPNNPLIRGERASGDALLGLGEYERRRNTLRKLRQQQYREYLDQQAKKKQEAKEQAERERREREEKDREREERERERLQLERERYSPEHRRASLQHVPTNTTYNYTTKVDTGVQVDGIVKPLSVAVQTDDSELYEVSRPKQLTQAERELSPRSVHDAPARRRSYDYDERTIEKKSNRDKLMSDMRHSYMPSIFDADAIQLRNIQAEKEAAARRQYYQQELKNQILEQQRIREERKTREKMLEQAEMRRLEEQLRMLRVAQEREVGRQHDLANAMKDNSVNYESKRKELQKEIETEQRKLIRVTSQPTRRIKRDTTTSKSDNQSYPKSDRQIDKKPYSMNIPDNSIFSANYDVESYLRNNLNFKPTTDYSRETASTEINDRFPRNNYQKEINIDVQTPNIDIESIDSDNVVVEKALVHERPEKKKTHRNHPSVKERRPEDLSVPLLRHSPKNRAENGEEKTSLSAAMKIVDDKWKVPAVQKNILKSIPNEEGKSISILTQLGSIRRQLQLEQLKLDKMLTKNDKS